MTAAAAVTLLAGVRYPWRSPSMGAIGVAGLWAAPAVASLNKAFTAFGRLSGVGIARCHGTQLIG